MSGPALYVLKEPVEAWFLPAWRGRGFEEDPELQEIAEWCGGEVMRGMGIHVRVRGTKRLVLGGVWLVKANGILDVMGNPDFQETYEKKEDCDVDA